MSKNTLKIEFVWKSLKIQTKAGYFLIFIIYSGQSLDSKTSLTLAKINVPSDCEWQRAQSQLFLRLLPPRLDNKFSPNLTIFGI
jgi:hypothetical protein